MKKGFDFIKSFASLLILSMILICVSSCSNFLSGSSLKTNLEDEIKRNTASNANVSVKKSNVDDTGVLEPSGTVSDVKVGYPIELSYEPSSAYYFVKWNAVDSNGDSFSEKDVEFADASNPLTKVTINTTEKVVIQANSALREKLSFSFDGENGSTVPADSKSFYEGEEFNLSWKADSSYAFLNWEVYNASDKKTKLDFSEYSKYLVFENIKSDDTVVKILDTGKSFIIKACSVQRPKILLGTPEFNSNGVNRDSRIRVLFNQNMRQNDDSYNVKDYITITNFVTGEDYLSKYYEEPQFANEKTLIIKAKKDNLPPEASEISIEISKNIQNKNGIGLKENYPWMYFVGREVDETAPIFKSLTVANMKNETEEDIEKYTSTFDSIKINSLSNKIFAKNKFIKLNATILDEGSSNVDCFYVDVIKVRNAEGNSVPTEEKINTVVCPVLSVVGALAQCKDWIINTEDELGITDNGTYKLEFHADDNSGNTRKYGELIKDGNDNVLQPSNDPIHLVGDYVTPVWNSFAIQCKAYDGTLKNLGTTKLANITDNVDAFRNAYCSDNNLYLTYTASDNNNIQKIELVYKRITDINYNDIESSSSETTETITTFNPMENTLNKTQIVDVRTLIMGPSTESKDGVYSVYFKLYDAVGLNKQTNTYYFVIDKTPPAADYSPLYQRTTEDSICIYSSGYPYDVKIAYLKVGDGDYKEFSRTAGRGKIENLNSETEYDVSIYYADYFDNISEPGTRKVTTGARGTPNKNASAGSNESLSLRYYNYNTGKNSSYPLTVVTNTSGDKITLNEPKEIELTGRGPTSPSGNWLFDYTTPKYQWLKSDDGTNWSALTDEVTQDDAPSVTITPPVGITYYALKCTTGNKPSYSSPRYSSVTAVLCGVGAAKDSAGWIAYSDNSITDLEHYNSSKTAVGVVAWSEKDDDGKERFYILNTTTDKKKFTWASNGGLGIYSFKGSDGYSIMASKDSSDIYYVLDGNSSYRYSLSDMAAFVWAMDLDKTGISGDFWFIPASDQFSQLIVNQALYKNSYLKIGGKEEIFTDDKYYWVANCADYDYPTRGAVMNFSGKDSIVQISVTSNVCAIARFYESD